MPELAVFDAYRAAIVANQMREDVAKGLVRYQAASKFLGAEILAVDGGESWTSERRRFVQGGWAYSALSTIVINDIPEFEDPNAVKCTRFSPHKRQVVCMALEIRAIYRLCGALFMCGGGVRSDAIGLIEDAYKRCTGMEDWERTYFQMLGNEILDDTMRPWNGATNDPQGLAFLSLTERRRQDGEKRKTKQTMIAKTTRLRPSGCVWNIHEPELGNAEWQKLLQSWISQATSNCSPHFIDTEDIWDETSKLYVELRADRDINAGELVLSERTRSNVTTSIPEEIHDDPIPPPSHRYYCDTCSYLMIVPLECPIRYKHGGVPVKAPSPPSASPTISESSLDSNNAAYGSDDYSTDPQIFSKTRPSNPRYTSSSPITILPPDTPPPHLSNTPTPSSPPDFMFCSPKHLVPTCSPACRKASSSFDHGLHHTSIERDLRTDHLLPPPTPKPLERRKQQCLIDLLVLRIFANACSTDMHPLQDNDLVFATCGPNHRHALERERTWSFADDVVRPLHFLDRVFAQVGTDQFSRLEVCDGWVLSTLVAKIESAMRVFRKPGFAKVFDREGKVERAVCAGEEGWSGVLCEKGGGDGEVWCASVSPIFNMIRVADPAKGERANVRVVRREGVLCYAVSGDGTEPAVRAGEALLRAADGDGEEGEGMEVGLSVETGVGRGGEEEGMMGVEGKVEERGGDDSGIWFDESVLMEGEAEEEQRGERMEVDIDN